MFATIIAVFITLWGIASYVQHRKSSFVIAVFLLASCCIFLIPKSVMLEDLAIVMVVAAILFDLSQGKKVFSLKGDSVGKIIVILLIYYLIAVVWTVIQGLETLVDALKVYRRDLFYLYYFVFKTLSVTDLKKLYKPLLVLTVIGGVLYYLQFAGICVLTDIDKSTEVAKGGFAKYQNIPMLGIPFMIYFIVRKEETSFWALLFWVGFQIVPMSRGGIIAAVIALTYYVIVSGRNRAYKHLFVKVLALVLLFSPILLFRFIKDNDRGTAAQDIKSAYSITDFSDFNYSDGGTFTFRIALALERINYMWENKETIPMGVGVIHEQSPNNVFDFYIGTDFITSDGEFKRQSIDTEDIAYISHLFRYGVIYLILFIIFIRVAFILLRADIKDNAISAVGFIMFLILVINSLTSDCFSFMRLMFVPLLCMAIIQTCNKEDLNRLFPVK